MQYFTCIRIAIISPETRITEDAQTVHHSQKFTGRNMNAAVILKNNLAILQEFKQNFLTRQQFHFLLYAQGNWKCTATTDNVNSNTHNNQKLDEPNSSTKVGINTHSYWLSMPYLKCLGLEMLQIPYEQEFKKYCLNECWMLSNI